MAEPRRSMPKADNPLVLFPEHRPLFKKLFYEEVSKTRRPRKKDMVIVRAFNKNLARELLEEPEGVMLPGNFIKVAIKGMFPKKPLRSRHDKKVFSNYATGGILYTALILQASTGRHTPLTWPTAWCWVLFTTADFLKKQIFKRVQNGKIFNLDTIQK